MLGHVVSSKGLEVDQAKVEVFKNLEPLTNLRQIRAFLRHAGFYRRFIQDFSKIARPLTALLAKDVTFEFNQECMEAFQIIKEALATHKDHFPLPFVDQILERLSG